jgi:hypothetical protein
MQAESHRPTSVKVLIVLAFILGALSIVTGITGILLGAQVVGDYSSLAATILLLLGAIVFLFGILEIVYGVGFLQGNGWSWTLAMVVAVVSLVSSIAVLGLQAIGVSTDVVVLVVLYTISAIALIPLMTSSLTIYLLTRPNVKAFFGRGPAATGNFGKAMEVN